MSATVAGERVDAPPVPAKRSWRFTPSTGKRLVAYGILVPGALLFVAPFVWLISASFQHVGDIFSWPPQWIPKNPTLDGYKVFFGVGASESVQSRAAEGVTRWFINSAIVATSITALQLLFNSMAAYVFAKRKFPGRDLIFLAFLATMMVPPQVSLIPNYLIMKHIPLFGGNDILGLGGHGMLDSYYGLILPSTATGFGIFLLRQYMLSIPDELLDAARIDGASELKIFWRIVLPLSRPALAAMAIFGFTYAWEDFLWPLIIISNPNHQTAPLGLALFVVKNRTSWDVLMAGSVIAMMPMVVVFGIFQRHFIRGISLSGIKG
jgi:multiple sugar transport system permease protein